MKVTIGEDSAVFAGNRISHWTHIYYGPTIGRGHVFIKSKKKVVQDDIIHVGKSTLMRLALESDRWALWSYSDEYSFYYAL